MTAAPRVVAFGVDTLYLHWKVPLDSSMVAKVLELREESAAVPLSKGGGIAVLEIGGQRLEVKPHASRTAPLFLHRENVMDVHLNPSPLIAAMPTVTIELRSIWLWQRGAEAAVADACAVVAELLPDGLVLPEDQLVPQVSRVDVCADFQWGETLSEVRMLLYPSEADDNEPGLRCRASSFAAYYKSKKRKCSGVTYGERTSDISAGVYNKTEEIRASSGKTWFEEVWKTSSEYVAGETVWRLEYRLKREGLRSLQCPDAARALLTWPDVAEHLAAIWKYLTSKWLVWRGRRTKSDRSTIDSRWKPFVELDVERRFHDGCSSVLRKRVDKVGEMAVAQTCGYLAQAKAHVELELQRPVALSEALPMILEKVERHGERTGRTLEMRSIERRLKMESLLAAAAPPTMKPARSSRLQPGAGAKMAAAAAAKLERKKRFAEGQRSSWRR